MNVPMKVWGVFTAVMWAVVIWAFIGNPGWRDDIIDKAISTLIGNTFVYFVFFMVIWIKSLMKKNDKEIRNAETERNNITTIDNDRSVGSRETSVPKVKITMQDQLQGTDDTVAIKYLSDMAELGDVSAQFELGLMYAEGRGAAKDDAQAVRWYRTAAEQGHVKAQNNLGWMYQEGRGVSQNDDEATYWYLKTAAQGDAEGQYNLGRMYQVGRGVAKDDAQAAQWYQKAAEQGHAEAQYRLALSYATGRGVSKDVIQAAQWYLKAAEQGHDEAKYAFSIVLSAEGK